MNLLIAFKFMLSDIRSYVASLSAFWQKDKIMKYNHIRGCAFRIDMRPARHIIY